MTLLVTDGTRYSGREPRTKASPNGESPRLGRLARSLLSPLEAANSDSSRMRSRRGKRPAVKLVVIVVLVGPTPALPQPVTSIRGILILRPNNCRDIRPETLRPRLPSLPHTSRACTSATTRLGLGARDRRPRPSLCSLTRLPIGPFRVHSLAGSPE